MTKRSVLITIFILSVYLVTVGCSHASQQAWLLRSKKDIRGNDKSWTASGWLEKGFRNSHFSGRVNPDGHSALVSPYIKINADELKTVEVFLNGFDGSVIFHVWFSANGEGFNTKNVLRVSSARHSTRGEPDKVTADFSNHPGWKGTIDRIRLMFHKINGHVPVNVWAVRFGKRKSYLFGGGMLPLEIEEPMAGGVFHPDDNSRIIPPERSESGQAELLMKLDKGGAAEAVAEMNHLRNGYSYPFSFDSGKISEGVLQTAEARFTEESNNIVKTQSLRASGDSIEVPAEAYRGFIVLRAVMPKAGNCSFYNVRLSEPSETGQRKWKAKWIWAPELKADQDCVFLKKFNVDKGAVAKAVLRGTCDDSFCAFLNDTQVLWSSQWEIPVAKDVTARLRDGENILRVKGHNGTSKAALLIELEIIDKDGKSTFVTTGKDWKLQSGQDVAVVGNVGNPPWNNIKFPYPENKVVYTVDTSVKPLGVSYSVSSSLGYPRIRCGDEMITPFFFGPRPRVFTPDAIRAGVEGDFHLYRFWVEFGNYWREDGSVDFSFLEHGFKTLVAADSEAKVYLAFRLTPPEWWLKKYPKESILFDNGLRHGGHYWELPSYASERWREDAKKYLEKFLDHTEGSWYADRIVAYMPCSHAGPEWFHDRAAGAYPDYSEPMKKYFRSQLRKTYKNDVALLRKSWNDNAVDFENAEPPSKSNRAPRERYFLDLKQDRAVFDFNRSMQTVVSEALGEMTAFIKEKTDGRKLTNAYYGYVIEMPELLTNLGMLGHYDFATAINNDTLNGFASPIPYSKRPAGDIGGSVTTLASLRLHNKIWIDEADNRTNLSTDGGENKHSKNLRLAISEARRDFAHAVIERTGLWFYDLSGGWFDNQYFIDDFKTMNRVYRQAFEMKVNFKPQIAVFFDEGIACALSFPVERWHNNEDKMQGLYRRGLGRCGAPFDTYLLSDLENVNLDQYKIIVFPNAWLYSDKLYKLVTEKVYANDRTVVWIYAPGYVNENGNNGTATMKKLTGFDFRKIRPEYLTVKTKNYSFGLPPMLPREAFGVEYRGPVKAIKLGSYEHSGKCGYAKISEANFTNIYMAAPDTEGRAWKDICRMAGVHTFCDRTDRVLYDGNFFAIHFIDGRGKRKITFDRQITELHDIFSDQKLVVSGKEFVLNGRPGETKMFYLKK